MRERLATEGPTFLSQVREVVEQDRLDDTFVDALCEPAEVFTYGGMIAHVLTFAAHRRTLVVLALSTATASSELGWGDPMVVGGDAAGVDGPSTRRHLLRAGEAPRSSSTARLGQRASALRRGEMAKTGNPTRAGDVSSGGGAGIVLMTLASGQFLMTLDSSVMNVSIAQVAEDVGTTVTGVQTAITLYTLVMATMMITGGKIGSIIGRKRAFTIGCVDLRRRAPSPRPWPRTSPS